jgi:peptidoglycan hydrolase FlgJ
MTTNIANSANSAGVYGDFSGLEKLKGAVRQQDPNALRQVAQQFESLFAKMMLKSMRKAIGKDPIFGSDQAEMYQGMFDDQLSLELTRGHGLGLADMLMKQLRGAGASPAAAAAPARAPAASAPAAAAPATTRTLTPASSAEKAQFVRTLWPQAQLAAQQLGVHPLGVVAQAALESNWGRSIPKGVAGASSNNLFGVKAGSSWGGDSVSAATQEFDGSGMIGAHSAFRAYPDAQASLQDYVATLKGNPRYSAALGSGNDVTAFASALQKAGYATDPHYATKVTSVAQQVAALVATGNPGETQVKFADARPITDGTTAL